MNVCGEALVPAGHLTGSTGCTDISRSFECLKIVNDETDNGERFCL